MISHRDAPGNAVRCTYEGTLKDMLTCVKPRQPKRIYYQQLSIRINELENKRQMKVLLLFVCRSIEHSVRYVYFVIILL
jgi:ubiquitin carboxyl-terminal hydrolase 7